MLSYDIAIRLYGLAIRLASLWNPKAKRWITGRSGWRERLEAALPVGQVYWIHCASLGEYQHARPFMMAMRKRDADIPWVLSFYSPSGYDNFKEHDLFAHVFYLPLDTRASAAQLLARISAKAVFFTKAELWPALWTALNDRAIPHYQFSASYHQDSSILSRALSRKCLQGLTLLCCQDEGSTSHLSRYDIDAVTTGNTRIDEVMRRRAHAKPLDHIKEWSSRYDLIVMAGSTWPEDIAIWSQWIRSRARGVGFLFAPHDVSEPQVTQQIEMLGHQHIIRHTQIYANSPSDRDIYCLDTVGDLATAYQYADIAYVGGGLRTGLHSTLEPAAYALPVLIGPRYQKFPEVVDMVKRATAVVCNEAKDITQAVDKLSDDDFRKEISGKQRKYMQSHLGAADRTADQIWSTLSR